MKTGHSNSSGGLGPKGIAALLLVVLFLVFVFQNTETVEITFLFWRVMFSRVILLLGALAVGCLAGVLLGWEMFSRRKR